MVPLHLSIKLHRSLSELDHTECDQFLETVVKRYGFDLIRKCIFSYFSNSCNEADDQRQKLDGLIEIVNGIITARDQSMESDENYEEVTEQKEPVSLLSLSAALIGEVAGYLEFEENIAFGQCCRDTYIGTNAPNTLRKLDASLWGDYSELNLMRYPQLRILELVACFSYALPLPDDDEGLCSHLKSLKLNNERSTNLDSDDILALATLPLNEITDLALVEFGYRGSADADVFALDLFFDLISRFPKVQTLYLDSFNLAPLNRAKSLELKVHFPDLKALIVDDRHRCSTELIKQMIHIFGSKLKALSLGVNVDLNISKETSFESLEELEVTRIPFIKTLLPIIRRSASGIKRMHLKWGMRRVQFFDLLSDYKQLEQLLISGKVNEMDAIVSAIDRALFNARNVAKRKTMQIKLWITDDGPIETSDVLYYVLRLLNSLISSQNIDDFLILWRVQNVYNISQRRRPSCWKAMMERFVIENDSRFDVTWTAADLLVSNKNCKIKECIHGYMKDDWMINRFW